MLRSPNNEHNKIQWRNAENSTRETADAELVPRLCGNCRGAKAPINLLELATVASRSNQRDASLRLFSKASTLFLCPTPHILALLNLREVALRFFAVAEGSVSFLTLGGLGRAKTSSRLAGSAEYLSGREFKFVPAVVCLSDVRVFLPWGVLGCLGL